MYTNSTSSGRVFRQARRRALYEGIRAVLTGRSADLLCYGKLRDFMEVTGTENTGVQEIPIKAVIGSVQRCSDYSRSFSPLRDSRGLPPINVYQVGDVYFVVDGHHRVSVAREFGQKFIAAQVVEVCTRVPLDPALGLTRTP